MIFRQPMSYERTPDVIKMQEDWNRCRASFVAAQIARREALRISKSVSNCPSQALERRLEEDDVNTFVYGPPKLVTHTPDFTKFVEPSLTVDMRTLMRIQHEINKLQDLFNSAVEGVEWEIFYYQQKERLHNGRIN